MVARFGQLANALAVKVVILVAERFAAVSAVLLKALPAMELMPAEKVTVARLEQFAKAESAIVVVPVLLKVTLSRTEHPRNAYRPIDVREAGRVRVVILKFSKANPPMVSRLEGIVRVPSQEHPEKA
jgi:hypothetical protein